MSGNDRHAAILKWGSSFLLLLTAFIWGIAFVAQSVGMEYIGPWTFVFLRFIIASIVLLPVTAVSRKVWDKDRREAVNVQDRGKAAHPLLLGGMLCGFLLGSASIAQQIGIQYTTVGKAGFITALYIIMIPIFGIFIGRKPGLKILIAAVMGLAGLYLISISGSMKISFGDGIILFCSVLFALQIMCVDYFSARVNPVELSNLEFFCASLVGFTGMILFEHPTVSLICQALLPILYVGVFSSAVAYTLQVVAQRHTEPTTASLLMSLESVFSALAGWALLGQRLTSRELFGCILVFAAVLIAQLPVENLFRHPASAHVKEMN